jgi:uncharacterized membrane protein YgcG
MERPAGAGAPSAASAAATAPPSAPASHTLAEAYAAYVSSTPPMLRVLDGTVVFCAAVAAGVSAVTAASAAATSGEVYPFNAALAAVGAPVGVAVLTAALRMQVAERDAWEARGSEDGVAGSGGGDGGGAGGSGRGSGPEVEAEPGRPPPPPLTRALAEYVIGTGVVIFLAVNYMG